MTSDLLTEHELLPAILCNLMDEVKHRFIDRYVEHDRYIAGIIIIDELPVRIVPANDENVIDQSDKQLYSIVCDEFPDFFIESLISFDEAISMCYEYSLPFKYEI